MQKPLVGILMGSDSDLETMQESVKILEKFDIGYEVVITSAHRSPKKTAQYAAQVEERGIQVLIAGAGHAAHLAGVLAAHTIVPVIGVPIDSSSLKGLDSLLSTAQMPGGIPVATMALGKSGAKNAGLLAVEILALRDEGLRPKLKQYREQMEREIEEKDRQIGKKGR